MALNVPLDRIEVSVTIVMFCATNILMFRAITVEKNELNFTIHFSQIFFIDL